MIRIDLLPREGGAKKQPRSGGGGAGGASKSEGGSVVVWLLILVLGAVMLGGAGYWGFTVYQETERVSAEKKKKKADKTKLQKQAKEEKAEFEKLRDKYDRAIDKARVLLMLDPPDRLIWAEKLNMLADMRPDGVALTNVKLIENVKMVETPKSREKRAEYDALDAAEKRKVKDKPVKEEVPIISQTLTITGVAYSQQPAKRLDDITKFGDLLEQYHLDMADRSVRRFMDNFVDEVKIGDLQVFDNYLDSGRNVTQFEFTLNTKAVEIKEADAILSEMVEDAERRSAEKKESRAEKSAGSFAGADISAP